MQIDQSQLSVVTKVGEMNPVSSDDIEEMKPVSSDDGGGGGGEDGDGDGGEPALPLHFQLPRLQARRTSIDLDGKDGEGTHRRRGAKDEAGLRTVFCESCRRQFKKDGEVPAEGSSV